MDFQLRLLCQGDFLRDMADIHGVFKKHIEEVCSRPFKLDFNIKNSILKVYNEENGIYKGLIRTKQTKFALE